MKGKGKSFLVFRVILGLIVGAGAQAGAPPIDAFHQVSPGIYRGARPGKALPSLLDVGIKSDLDLENNDDAIRSEKKLAQALGINFISMPMSGFWSPNDSEVDRILAIVEDPANYPLYIHCQYGHDRTGLIVGLFRVFAEKVAPAKAYKEMKDLGFHPALVFLNHYFEEKTGFED